MSDKRYMEYLPLLDVKGFHHKHQHLRISVVTEMRVLVLPTAPGGGQPPPAKALLSNQGLPERGQEFENLRCKDTVPMA